MSGAHAAHRTPNRPLYGTKGQPIPALDGHFRIKLKLVTEVIGRDKHGNPVKGSVLRPAQRHVLDYRPPLTRASKHRAGRTKPMTTEERRVRDRFNRRRVRLSKAHTLDFNAIQAAASA